MQGWHQGRLSAEGKQVAGGPEVSHRVLQSLLQGTHMSHLLTWNTLFTGGISPPRPPPSPSAQSKPTCSKHRGAAVQQSHFLHPSRVLVFKYQKPEWGSRASEQVGHASKKGLFGSRVNKPVFFFQLMSSRSKSPFSFGAIKL